MKRLMHFLLCAPLSTLFSLSRFSAEKSKLMAASTIVLREMCTHCRWKCWSAFHQCCWKTWFWVSMSATLKVKVMPNLATWTIPLCRRDPSLRHMQPLCCLSRTKDGKVFLLYSAVERVCSHLCNIIGTVLNSTVPSVLWHCWLGGRKGIRPVKNWVVGFWHGYLSGARCRSAYGSADATATHYLVLQ